MEDILRIPNLKILNNKFGSWTRNLRFQSIKHELRRSPTENLKFLSAPLSFEYKIAE
jgi:hypothetical protein